jgi:hypothetical protein
VVCVAPGFTAEQLAEYTGPHIRFSSEPVDLEPLLNADLCMTYGAEGTIISFLRAGVPQLISPWHVETFMAAKRVELAHLGVVYRGDSCGPPVDRALRRVFESDEISVATQKFAARVPAWDLPVDSVVAALTGTAKIRSGTADRTQRL